MFGKLKVMSKPKSYTALLPCQQCGKVFKGRAYPYKGSDIIGYTDKICGKACKAARRTEKLITKKCPICGTEFTSYKTLNRITCSNPCKIVYSSKDYKRLAGH